MAIGPGRTPRPAEVVRRYLDEVLGEGDMGALEELVSNEEFARRVVGFRQAFPDLSIKTELLISEGDLVAVHVIGRGTHRSVFQGVPATNRPWSAGCSALYRVRDGRIADFWVNWDLLSILEQTGGVTRASTASA